jgi:hypothetical protein
MHMWQNHQHVFNNCIVHSGCFIAKQMQCVVAQQKANTCTMIDTMWSTVHMQFNTPLFFCKFHLARNNDSIAVLPIGVDKDIHTNTKMLKLQV